MGNERPLEILVSIRPRWAEAIMDGRKTVEYRRNIPMKTRLQIGKMWIYATKPIGMVLGTAKVEVWTGSYGNGLNDEEQAKAGCLTVEELREYFKGAEYAFAIKILKVTPFKRPKTLAEIGVKRAPKSWMYMNREDISNETERKE